MKHEAAVRNVLATMHEPWMNDSDKAEFDAIMIDRFGEQLDASIETGVSNGYTPERQMEIAQTILKGLA